MKKFEQTSSDSECIERGYLSESSEEEDVEDFGEVEEPLEGESSQSLYVESPSYQKSNGHQDLQEQLTSLLELITQVTYQLQHSHKELEPLKELALRYSYGKLSSEQEYETIQELLPLLHRFFPHIMSDLSSGHQE